MKLKFLLTALIFTSLTAKAQTKIKSQLKSAMVYTNGAILSHDAQVNYQEGNQTILLVGVSNSIEDNSIIVSLPTFSTLLSVTPRQIPVQKATMSSDDNLLLDSLKSLQKRKSLIHELIKIEEHGIQILQKNEVLTQSKEFSTADVLKAYDEYKKRMENSYIEIAQYREELSRIDLQINEKTAAVNQRGLNTQYANALELVIQNTQSANQKVMFSYYTSNARWIPSYVISNDDAKPLINLDYKARIFQNTGFDWNQVKLSVSTGNPQMSNLQPVIQKWYAQYYRPAQAYGYEAVTSNNGKLLESAELRMDKKEKEDIKTVVTNNFVTTSVFEIQVPYDVKTSNKPVLANLKEYSIPATIYFYAVPKLDRDVYMLASFSFDEAVELIPGEALIMNSGTYVGKTTLDPYTASDTLRLSLGRTPAIQVKRDMLKSMCKTSALGGKSTTQRYYSFSCYNGLNRNIRLLVKDHVPVSTLKDITIETLQISDGYQDPNSGIVTWDFNLAPKASKSFEFGFEVKHPKDRTIEGL